MKKCTTYKKYNNKSVQEILNERLFESYLNLLSEEKEDVEKKTDKNKSDEQQTNEIDEETLKTLNIDKSEVDKQLANIDGKKKAWYLKTLSFLAKMLNSASDSLLASNLEDFTLGNFKESICEIYKEKKLSKMSEDELKAEAEAVHKSPGYASADKKSNLSSRKDDNENTNIDKSSVEYTCMFWSENDKDNLLKQLEEVATEIQKKGKEILDSREKLKQEVKSKKIEGVGDGEIDAFAPVIQNMLDDGKSPDEISKEIQKLKTGVKESYNRKINRYTRQKILTEGKCLITEKQKNIFLMESLIESDTYIDHLTLYLLNEGFLDGIKKLGKAVGKAAGKAIKSGAEISKQVWNKVPEKYRNMVKDISEKAMEKLKDGALAPILSIAGLGLIAATGGLGIALAISAMVIIQRHGKYIKASFDKHWEAFKNSNGVITTMNFNIKDNPKLKYSLRFYAPDQSWRVLNLRNQSHTPSIDFAKAIIKGEVGQAYIKKITSHWDPVFNKEKGGKIDFSELLSQSKDLTISKEQLKMMQDFKEQYDSFLTAMNKPQIDTRALSVKDVSKSITDKVKSKVDSVKDTANKIKDKISKK